MDRESSSLGRLKDPSAVPALASVLDDEDALLRALAVEALAEIQHRDAIRPLVPLLGDHREADGRRFQDRVAGALKRLGAGELADTVLAALGGDFGPLQAYRGEYRAQVIAALAGALKGPAGMHAADALAEINAVEALPDLRVMTRARMPERTAQAVAGAIRKLEARASLPRAASAADRSVDTLPRSAREPDPDRATLPRGSRVP